ncbi:metal ABC transporter permease [Pseudonocardia sichuanensis]|uniref:Manganese/zinc/iron transport system permease protein n=1 Tax=Pseudonocardia kunmingensis TaxID=630975 RepID=A0A543DA33_9PSEU|nr:metal ABC transporter permease [Pseudonocardia kunmingensis]TQM06191.1 manganese/zinc/iron transport system permease protein [Pseudonocardia kunmingensis]
MNDGLLIVLVAGLVATACGLLGPFLVLRRMALLSDAVSHAVLPGIVAVWLVAQTRASLPVVFGAAAFAVLCVLGIDALRSTGLVASDAAIGLVFPALFSLGVLGVTRYADGIHLDLDSTIYGEIAFVPFDTVSFGGHELARSGVVLGVVVLLNLLLVVALWKELKATTFDPQFGATVRLHPRLLSRLLLVAAAVTAVAAFDAVGAILVVTMLIVPAATAFLLTDRLVVMVALAVGIGWVGAGAGYAIALPLDSSIAGAMGLVCAACFTLALLVSPRHGVLTRRWRRRRAGVVG